MAKRMQDLPKEEQELLQGLFNSVNLEPSGPFLSKDVLLLQAMLNKKIDYIAYSLFSDDTIGAEEYKTLRFPDVEPLVQEETVEESKPNEVKKPWWKIL